MILGYKELKSITRMNLSHKPLLGSNTSPPLYLSRFPFVVFWLSGSPSCDSCLTATDFFPHTLSGQIYFKRWNSCSRMYSFRSARPPLRVLFLGFQRCQKKNVGDSIGKYFYQELPARFVNCRVSGKICTFAAMAI